MPSPSDIPPPSARPLEFPLFHAWRRQGRAYRQLRWFWRSYLTTCHRLTIHQLEKLPPEGPVILAGNHPSAFDPVTLLAASPRRVSFLAAEWNFRLPIWRRMFLGTNMICVERAQGGAPALRRALRLLKEGWVIGIYPAGNLVSDADAAAAKEGVVLMAASSGATVVPVFTHGTADALPDDGSWRARVGKPVSITFGEPFRVELTRLQLKDKAIVNAEVERVMERIRETGESSPAAK